MASFSATSSKFRGRVWARSDGDDGDQKLKKWGENPPSIKENGEGPDDGV